MFILLSKVVPGFFYPLSVALFLLATAIVIWRRRQARWLCFTALTVLAIFGSPIVSGALVRSLESQYPEAVIESTAPAQAIVVLGGAIHAPNSRHKSSGLINPSDRLLQALRLYRAGKAPMVMCSGGNHPLYSEPGQVSEARVMSRLLQEWGVGPDAIRMDERSVNTRQNAVFSFQALSGIGVRRILLVTSALHMPRAAAVFRKAGFEVTPAPADFRSGWEEGTVLLKWIPASGDLMWSEMALREWLGLLVYRMRGWL